MKPTTTRHNRNLPLSLPVTLLFWALVPGAATGAHAAGSKTDKGLGDLGVCADLLVKSYPSLAGSVESTEGTLSRLHESMLLVDFIRPDFIKAHPLSIMNAAQRFLAIVGSQGNTTVFDPQAPGGKRVVPNLFYKGVPVVDGLRVVGNYAAGEVLMNQIRALAEGRRSGLYTTLLVGGPGSGKSEFIKITRTGMGRITARDPKYAIYTFGWTGTQGIPRLANLLPPAEFLPSPMNESPYALLPEEIQGSLREAANAASREMTETDANPRGQLNPYDEFIRAQILAHYTELKGAPLTLAEIVGVLNRHIRVTRLTMDSTNIVTLNKQKKDVDYAGLFMKANPLIQAMLGTAHPLAYYYTGALLRANGGIIFFDEIGKNPPDLLANFLTFIQDRSVSEGGMSRPVQVDFVAVAATNTKDIADILAKDPQSPFVDRMVQVGVNWLTYPQLVAKITALELGNLWATELPLKEAGDTYIPGNAALNELFPEQVIGEEVLTTDGRYRLVLGDPARVPSGLITVEPHALMYLSAFVALTRMTFEEKAIAQALDKKEGEVIAPIFRDPISRLHAYLGRGTLTAAQRSELAKFSIMTGEGTFGVSARTTSRILEAAILEAKKSGGSLTAGMIRKAIDRAFVDGTLGPDAEKNIQWARLFAQIAYREFALLPYRADMNAAMNGAGNADATRIYDELITEIIALHADPEAREYLDPTTATSKPIRRPRLAEISAKYKAVTGRDLDVGEIATFVVSNQRAAAKAGAAAIPTRNRDLMSAVSAWQAEKLASAMDASVSTVFAVAAGTQHANEAQAEQANLLIETLVRDFGYSKKGALDIVTEVTAQLEREKAAAQQPGGR